MRITVRDIAMMVEERERELAPGSETCLLHDFVRDFGDLQDALFNYEQVDNYHIWKRAYDRLSELLPIRDDFDCDDLWV